MVTWRTLILIFCGMIGSASVCNAQRIRIGNAGVIPNGGMTPPTIMTSTVATYPDEARTRGIESTVTLQAVIKTDGTVDILRVVRGMPLGLTESAIEALKQWMFNPGSKDGKSVDVVVNIEINFNLRR